ncbi:histidine kinase [Robertmurraya massiliosenegalensis]|uniref:sensor histidine kinase n=1 Tax=Robertmurraya TaxID=2837507 RepID=UPI0039A64204
MNSESYTLNKFVMMKLKKLRYITFRVGLLLIVIFSLMFILLITCTILSIQEGRIFIFCMIGYMVMGLLLYVFYKYIFIPYKQGSKILHLFVTGYTIHDLFEQRILISPEIEEVTNKVQEIMDKGEMFQASKKHAQYWALQNQINPHFLYNALEGIRGETLNAGLENVAKMTEALATYFRYTISNMENLVTLEDELMNVNNYYIIQKYRFGARIRLEVDYDLSNEKEIMMYKVPKLTLQPIVENAIYHGIERNIKNGELRIKVEPTAKRLIITISDNGMGMSEERLKEINNKLYGTSFNSLHNDSKANGGIALVNVNNRIKLLFGEEYGICLYSAMGVGTDVEITLPLLKR